MTIICVALFSCFCVTGCGASKSCEKLGYGSHDADGIKVSGCSIPGCGGCLSLGKRCNSACCPQSCKISNEKSCYSGCGKWDGENKIKGIFYGYPA